MPQVAVQADQPPQLCLAQWVLMLECWLRLLRLVPGQVEPPQCAVGLLQLR